MFLKCAQLSKLGLIRHKGYQIGSDCRQSSPQGHAARNQGVTLPVVHDLERRNVAGNLPNCGSKCVKRAEPVSMKPKIRLARSASKGSGCGGIPRIQKDFPRFFRKELQSHLREVGVRVKDFFSTDF